MIRYVLLIYTLILFSLQGRGQRATRDLLSFGLGVERQAFQDDFWSPLNFSGWLGHLSIGHYAINEKWLTQLDIGFSAGFQTPGSPLADGQDNRVTTYAGHTRKDLPRALTEQEVIMLKHFV
jgi:hypothetical protein